MGVNSPWRWFWVRAHPSLAELVIGTKAEMESFFKRHFLLDFYQRVWRSVRAFMEWLGSEGYVKGEGKTIYRGKELMVSGISIRILKVPWQVYACTLWMLSISSIDQSGLVEEPKERRGRGTDHSITFFYLPLFYLGRFSFSFPFLPCLPLRPLYPFMMKESIMSSEKRLSPFVKKLWR